MSQEEKKPQGNWNDKLRSFFGYQDPLQERKNALPPKAHFSIWYFFDCLPLDFLSATMLSSRQGGDYPIQQVQGIRGPRSSKGPHDRPG